MTEFEQRLREAMSNSYDIERELGGGGMSRVFVATDKSLGRKIVIKLLSPELLADVNRGRFRREIQVAAQLQHPHIVPLLSAGEYEDLVYYTMPFISGESLKSAVDKRGPLPIREVVRVLYHVGEALDYAHGEGVVHRDIKPANILRSGTYALVTDFGVAKALNAAMPGSGMTATGTAIGTPAYMAPEQLAGDPAADHRIDIYALGLMAYELLNGRSPYAATSPQKILLAVLSQDAAPLIEVRPDVPARLSEIVMRCLAKEPDDRPANARALLAALDSFSTTSGEIRTMEHKVPRVDSMAPGIVPAVPGSVATEVPSTSTPAGDFVTGGTILSHVPPAPVASAPVVPTPVVPTPVVPTPVEPTFGAPTFGAPTPAAPAPVFELAPRKNTRKRLIIGGLALLIPVAAGAIFLSQRTGNTLPPPSAPLITQPAPVDTQPAAVLPQPGAAPQNPVAATPADSQRVADSLKKAKAAAAKLAAAKNDSLRKADSVKRAAANTDSARKVQEPNRIKARAAASGLLANPGARKAFADGATHKGGLLGSKTKGDLQTQIDALQPFLKGSGLTYEQFKDAVKASGITLFDQFGRMVPDSLQRFASAGR